MRTPITVEWVSGNGFLARDALGLEGRGWSPQEAWDALRAASDAHFQAVRAASTVWSPAPLTDGEHPLAAVAGSWQPTDEEYREYWAAVEEYRRQCDREAGVARTDTPDAA